MNNLQNVLQQAVAEGLLPADTSAPNTGERPWPVVLLTGLGAWLVALPLLGLLLLLFRDVLETNAGQYIAALLLLGIGTFTMRLRQLPIFVEQLAFALLPAGLVLLAFALSTSALFGNRWGPASTSVLASTALLLAIGIPRRWLRALFGAVAGALFATLGLTSDFTPSGSWISCHAALMVWLIALYAQRHVPVRSAPMIESIAGGWLVAVLTTLALASGMTFLLGGVLGIGGFGDLSMQSPGALSTSALLQRGGSMLLALAGALYAAYRWPGLRRPLCGCVALVLVGLCAWLPMLGGTLLAMSVVGTTRRWQQAAFAALAAAWIVGTFYYGLQWSLALKGSVLIATAVALAVLARLSGTTLRPAAMSRFTGSERRATLLLGSGALCVLAVANIGIWQKESLIAHGQPVFIALTPADPRSLMQGDYMRLNFVNFPNADFERSASRVDQAHVVMQRGARGVATPLRAYRPDAPLAADEFLIELTPRAGRWTLVTDAWYFTEGEAAQWNAARFGDFRVLPDGKALLVGLADAQLQPLKH